MEEAFLDLEGNSLEEVRSLEVVDTLVA